MEKHLRFYPASHALNRDPQFIALRKKTRDWMGYIWHEMLAWGDRTGGELKGKPEQIADTLAPNSLQKYLKPAADSIRNAFKLMEEYGWIQIETDRILIVNHAKFHRKRKSKKNQIENNVGAPLPSFLPKLPNQLEEPPTPLKGGEAGVAHFQEKTQREAGTNPRANGSNPRAGASAAWDEVVQAISRVGYTRVPDFSSPLIANTVRTIGGWGDLCRSDQRTLPTLKARFFDAYQAERNREP